MKRHRFLIKFNLLNIMTIILALFVQLYFAEKIFWLDSKTKYDVFYGILLSTIPILIIFSIIITQILKPLNNFLIHKANSLHVDQYLYNKARGSIGKVIKFCALYSIFYMLLTVVIADIWFMKFPDTFTRIFAYIEGSFIGILLGVAQTFISFYLLSIPRKALDIISYDPKVDNYKYPIVFKLISGFFITIGIIAIITISTQYNANLSSNMEIKNIIADKNVINNASLKNKLDQMLDRNEKVLSENRIELFIYAVIILVFMFLIYVGISGTIIQPLKDISRTLQDKLNGKASLTKRLNILYFDEIGDVIQDINNFSDKLFELVKDVKEYVHSVDESSNNLDNAINNSNQIIENMTKSINDVEKSVKEQTSIVSSTDTFINEIIASLVNVSTSINSQATVVDQSSAAINQMAANINSVSETTNKANEISKGLSVQAIAGSTSVLKAIEAIKEIEESSKQVQEIVSVIGNIAEQTNLLAMNAAIEAAHAGDYGKGFAVVADEIRKLAENTASYAKEIVSHIKVSSEKVTNGVYLSEEAGKSLGFILKEIDETTKLISEISSSMFEQNSGAKQILTSIVTLVNATQEIKFMMEEQRNKSFSIKEIMINLVEITKKVELAMNNQQLNSQEIVDVLAQTMEVANNNEQIVDKLMNLIDGFNLEEQNDKNITSITQASEVFKRY